MAILDAPSIVFFCSNSDISFTSQLARDINRKYKRAKTLDIFPLERQTTSSQIKEELAIHSVFVVIFSPKLSDAPQLDTLLDEITNNTVIHPHKRFFPVLLIDTPVRTDVQAIQVSNFTSRSAYSVSLSELGSALFHNQLATNSFFHSRYFRRTILGILTFCLVGLVIFSLNIPKMKTSLTHKTSFTAGTSTFPTIIPTLVPFDPQKPYNAIIFGPCKQGSYWLAPQFKIGSPYITCLQNSERLIIPQNNNTAFLSLKLLSNGDIIPGSFNSFPESFSLSLKINKFDGLYGCIQIGVFGNTNPDLPPSERGYLFFSYCNNNAATWEVAGPTSYIGQISRLENFTLKLTLTPQKQLYYINDRLVQISNYSNIGLMYTMVIELTRDDCPPNCFNPLMVEISNANYQPLR